MNVAQAKKSLNNLEKIGYSFLDDLSLVYERQHLINGKFCVDAFVPGIKLIVQFDGDYWHGNFVLFSRPDARQQKRIRLDASQDAYLKKCGYTICRVWESQMKHDSEGAKNIIRQAVEKCAVSHDVHTAHHDLP